MYVKNGPIGMLDSGVGGLTVVREIKKFLPQEEIVYYGDTLHLPYGSKLLSEVREYVVTIFKYLVEEKKVKAVILACNTATSAALEIRTSNYNIPVFGTIKSVCKKAYQQTVNKKIGVIGTEGTINSQAYQKQLLQINPALKVFSVACPRFVDLVEKGKFSGPEVEKTAEKYLVGLRETGIDVLILGCTHFPYLIPVLGKTMGEQVTLISSGEAMALEIKSVLAEKNLLNNAGNPGEITQQEFLVSDKKLISQDFLTRGREFLDLPELEFKEKNIFNLQSPF